MATLLTFFPVCFGVSFVCTAVKDTDQDRILAHTGKLFLYIVGGIGAFSIVVQGLTLMLD